MEETVAVYEGGTVIATTGATTLGQFSVSVGYTIAAIPTTHTVQAQGMKSGRISNTTGFTT